MFHDNIIKWDIHSTLEANVLRDILYLTMHRKYRVRRKVYMGNMTVPMVMPNPAASQVAVFPLAHFAPGVSVG
jgi:hypothetical protein